MIRYLNLNIISNNNVNNNIKRFYSTCGWLLIKLRNYNITSSLSGRDLLLSLSILNRFNKLEYGVLKNNNDHFGCKLIDITNKKTIIKSKNFIEGGIKSLSLNINESKKIIAFSRSLYSSSWSETRRKLHSRLPPFFNSQLLIVSHYSNVTYYPLGGMINGSSNSNSSCGGSSSSSNSIINNKTKRFINDRKSNNNLISHNNNNNNNNNNNINKLNMNLFKFSDYDCVGFDLDNTLLKYNITNMVKLEYECLSKFLINKRGYDTKYLNKELKKFDIDFMQKGLVIDFERGNILRFSPDGKILKASHGTRLLSDDELDIVYKNRRWHVTDKFKDDPLVTWNGPLSEKMRTLLDYFDMPASLAFARIVDTIDDNNNGKQIMKYNVWPDVLDGLIDMFDRENFSKDNGNYFPELKNNPDKYLHKSSEKLVDWLKELKKRKITYLITGSNSDFANFTASYAFGDNWRSLFDIVICYAKKPGFFTGSRDFLKAEDGGLDGEIISVSDLKRGGIYSQGNWKGLKDFFANEIGNNLSPNCLYVGDNLIQDIYTPNRYVNCDTIAVVEEQLSEGMLNNDLSHNDENILNSKIWGSYFNIESNGKILPSIWYNIIKKHSKICIPSVDFIINNSFDKSIKCFSKEEEEKEEEDDDDDEKSGYYPGKPKSVAIL